LVAGHQRGAHPRHLVRGDRFSVPASTQHDAALDLAPRHALGDREAEVRVVDRRLGRPGPEVRHLVSERLELALEPLLERVACGTAADRDLHAQARSENPEPLYERRAAVAARVEAAPLAARSGRGGSGLIPAPAACGMRVSQPWRSGASPRTTPKNASWI